MKVFCRPEQVGPAQHSSPSAYKPRLVVEDWTRVFGAAIEVCSFEPATQTQIARAHNAANGAYERWLSAAIDKCKRCDVVLYQAGADPHIDDPLGGILTTVQMSARDRSVFEKLGHLPMVWNLAGGYQVVAGETVAAQIEPVLALHRETARLHCEIFG